MLFVKGHSFRMRGSFAELEFPIIQNYYNTLIR